MIHILSLVVGTLAFLAIILIGSAILDALGFMSDDSKR
jgi:hypothetical protein